MSKYFRALFRSDCMEQEESGAKGLLAVCETIGEALNFVVMLALLLAALALAVWVGSLIL